MKLYKKMLSKKLKHFIERNNIKDIDTLLKRLNVDFNNYIISKNNKIVNYHNLSLDDLHLIANLIYLDNIDENFIIVNQNFINKKIKSFYIIDYKNDITYIYTNNNTIKKDSTVFIDFFITNIYKDIDVEILQKYIYKYFERLSDNEFHKKLIYYFTFNENMVNFLKNEKYSDSTIAKIYNDFFRFLKGYKLYPNNIDNYFFKYNFLELKNGKLILPKYITNNLNSDKEQYELLKLFKIIIKNSYDIKDIDI